MTDFLEHRQNVIEDIPRETINAWISKMLDYLGGEIWLKKSKNIDHPIVKLWNRKDFMATNELINFANAVNIMDQIDSKWTAQTMKIAASKDHNNVHGAIFEILALSTFCENNCRIEPASMSNPGIDGVIRFPDGMSLNLSLKYYGVSYSEREFQTLMEEIDDIITNKLNKMNLLSADVAADIKRYPELPKDKSKLKKQIETAMELYEKNIGNVNPVVLKDELVDIVIHPIKGFDLSTAKKSYKLIARSPMHQNEYKNLRDKIDDACSNLKKHSSNDNSSFNGIVIHMHENADIDSYQQEIQSYLDSNYSNPDSLIDYIILYQPCVTYDVKTGQYGVFHVIKPAVSARRLEGMQGAAYSVPSLTFFLGDAGTDTPKMMLFADGTELSELKDRYLYQKGEIYENPRVGLDGSISGRSRMIAPGIRASSVFSTPKGETIIPQLITFESAHLEIT